MAPAPMAYLTYKTGHRRLQAWCHREVLREVPTQPADTLHEERAINGREQFTDATVAAAKGAARP